MFAHWYNCVALMIFLTVSANFAQAASDVVVVDCESSLKTNTLKAIEDLPPVWNHPLPKAVTDIIRKHPIQVWADYIQTRSLQLDFAVEVPMHMTDDPHTKAESLQARMIANYLRMIFPKSEITHNELMLSPATRNKRNIKISIFDPAENETKGEIAHQLYKVTSSPEEMPVPLMKLGTPHIMPSTMTKLELRRQLGFPAETKRIASLYVPSVKTLEDESILLDVLERLGDFDHIIVSFNQPEFGFEDNDLLMSMTPLSKLAKKDQPNKLIWNDSVYRMPYIYQISDFAIVAGNINFLEPLNARLPTVLYHRPSMKQDYNQSVLEHMVAQAGNSGAFFKVVTPKTMDKFVDRLITTKPKVLPPALLVKNGKTNLDRVLDRLLEMLKKQTGY